MFLDLQIKTAIATKPKYQIDSVIDLQEESHLESRDLQRSMIDFELRGREPPVIVEERQAIQSIADNDNLPNASNEIVDAPTVLTGNESKTIIQECDLKFKKVESETGRSVPLGPKAYHRGRGVRKGDIRYRQDPGQQDQKEMATPKTVDYHYRMSLSEDDARVYDGMTTVMNAFNDDASARIAESNDEEDRRVRNTRFDSYIICRSIEKPPVILYRLDLQSNEHKQIPAAELANTQAKKIREQGEQIRTLRQRLSKYEKYIDEYKLALGELRIKNHIQETRIAKLEAEVVEHQAEEDTIDQDSTATASAFFGFGSITEAL